MSAGLIIKSLSTKLLLSDCTFWVIFNGLKLKNQHNHFFFFTFFLQKTQLVSYNSATNPLLQNKSLILQAWTHLLLTMQEYQGESWQKLPVLIWSSRQDIELKMYKYLQINKNKGGVEPWNVHWSSSPHFQSHSCFCPGSGRKPMARDMCDTGRDSSSNQPQEG